MSLLREGRFNKEPSALAAEYNNSLPIDKKMYKEDINASIAHAKMLKKCGIISEADGDKIVGGLLEILSEIQSGKLVMENAEDIHMFVETELTKKIGIAGKRLHTGRSRNDQVVTDFKLYIKSSIFEVNDCIKTLINSLITISEKHLETYMPGFTHMQKAQPITLAFHLMAYAQMFLRDYDRFSDCLKRLDLSPLGSGALASTTYPIDRKYFAEEIGFSGITENAMDAVSDRDYAAEYIFAATMTMTHLSRFAEEVIAWASDEYRFIEISDEYSTGSSIMPQKKNPDMAELVRGKTGRIIGNLVAITTVLKGIPLAYNKDLQEDKDIVFQTEETLINSLKIFSEMLLTAAFNKERMLSSAIKGYTNATDFADYLVKKGSTFRDAHIITGNLVRFCIESNTPIENQPLDVLKRFSPLVDEDVYVAIDIKTVVNGRNVYGGTAPEAVRVQIENLKEKINNL